MLLGIMCMAGSFTCYLQLPDWDMDSPTFMLRGVIRNSPSLPEHTSLSFLPYPSYSSVSSIKPVFASLLSWNSFLCEREAHLKGLDKVLDSLCFPCLCKTQSPTSPPALKRSEEREKRKCPLGYCTSPALTSAKQRDAMSVLPLMPPTPTFW